jgi:hypothetical protein
VEQETRQAQARHKATTVEMDSTVPTLQAVAVVVLAVWAVQQRLTQEVLQVLVQQTQSQVQVLPMRSVEVGRNRMMATEHLEQRI